MNLSPDDVFVKMDSVQPTIDQVIRGKSVRGFTQCGFSNIAF